MKKIVVPIIAIFIIAGLELAALSHGLNGTILSLSIGMIAGIAGYHIKSRIPYKDTEHRP